MLDGTRLTLADLTTDADNLSAKLLLQDMGTGFKVSLISPVPEPSTIALLVIGGVALAGTIYRKRR